MHIDLQLGSRGNSLTYHINYVDCIHCDEKVYVPEDFAEQYFLAKSARCEECEKEFDWWETILASIRDARPHYYDAFAVLNLRANKDVVKLIPNDYVVIQPGRIAPGSNILNVIYGKYEYEQHDGEGHPDLYGPVPAGLIPFEDQGDIPNRHSVPEKIRLYAAPEDEGTVGKTELGVFVLWVPEGDDQAWQNLYQAFEAYTDEHYESAVIPANVAVELTMTHLLTEFLENVASKTSVRSFLREATYSHQLKVLLPAVINSTDAPRLPKHIYRALNDLNKHRNKVAHNGKLDPIPSRAEMAKCLCAAAFGFHYLRLVRPFLLK